MLPSFNLMGKQFKNVHGLNPRTPCKAQGVLSALELDLIIKQNCYSILCNQLYLK